MVKTAGDSGAYVAHAVRRYGPVGGMERYVWEVTRELAALGHHVQVLCEQVDGQRTPDNVHVSCLGQVLHRPRWMGYLLFSRRVAAWLRTQGGPDWILHSHERCSGHHITTFHGPPFAAARTDSLWKRMSIRMAMNLWLERREVAGRSVRLVVPNSRLMGDELRLLYPEAADRVTRPVLPGVAPGPTRPVRAVPTRGGVLGFIGYEWRRKGLDIAVEVASCLLTSRPNLELWVAGAAPRRVSHLFASYKGRYRLLGNVSGGAFFPFLDLLIHPARREPFALVVLEAMAANVPVLISSQCGVQTEVGEQHGAVLPLDSPPGVWAEVGDRLLARADSPAGYSRPWSQVALEYAELYRRILVARKAQT